MIQCWCGNTATTEFGQGYRRCDACQTLVAEISPAQLDSRVKNDSADYYGKDYWFAHQTQHLGLPDLASRTRSDLAERCVHWLRSLLQFKTSPAKVLEIGCAHGGFVAMLRQAGFDAMGLELSPAIVEYAAKTFGIPVLTGPIEDQSIPNDSLDAIVLMDVMEHLPYPKKTLGKCLELLRPDGILLVQTPGYPEGKSLAQLESENHKFPQMLDRNEHLFLFSPTSAREIFRQLGTPHIQFIPAIFGFYDMSFVVSPGPLKPIPPETQAATLAACVSGRFLQALLDLDERRLNLLEKYRELKRRLDGN